MTIRVATYNTSLSRPKAGQLATDIAKNDPQVTAIINIIVELDADILLINEFDYTESNNSLTLFIEKINSKLPAEKHYRDFFTAAVNTGIACNIDFNKDGRLSLPTDAYGFGYFPGQYGMALLSRFPIQRNKARTFQKFLWKDLGSKIPTLANRSGLATNYFSEQEISQLRLSSKSHWDIPVETKQGKIIRCLCSHPTPPVFDGKERRNFFRNAAEIRFWSEYLSSPLTTLLTDDKGTTGGFWPQEDDILESQQTDSFVILGDLNNDPNDGEGDSSAIEALLQNPLINDTKPTSARFSSGRPYTAKFSKSVKLRTDYVLPSATLNCVNSGVFWPEKTDPINALFTVNKKPVSDHFPVWADLDF